MKSEQSEYQTLFTCKCHDVSHMFVISYDTDPEWPDVYVSVHLATGGFWYRLWNGLKYIFGKKSIFGDFDEVILQHKDADKLQEVVNHLKRVKAMEEAKSEKKLLLD